MNITVTLDELRAGVGVPPLTRMERARSAVAGVLRRIADGVDADRSFTISTPDGIGATAERGIPQTVRLMDEDRRISLAWDTVAPRDVAALLTKAHIP